MNGSAKTSTWVLGTAFVALIIMLLSWFLLISPVFATADERAQQTETANAQNRDLQVKVNALKADFAKIDDYRAEVASLAEQITPDLELAEYIETLSDLAEDNDVVIVGVEPQSAVAVEFAEGTGAGGAAGSGGEVSTEAPAPEPTPSATAGTDGAVAAAPEPEGVRAPTGMTSVPFKVTVVGDYDKAMDFLDDVQSTTRLFLVAGYESTVQEDADSGSGRPATELGQVEFSISGFLYALPSLAPVPDPDAEPEAEPKLPKGTDRNPMMPIEGDSIGSSSSDD